MYLVTLNVVIFVINGKCSISTLKFSFSLSQCEVLTPETFLATDENFKIGQDSNMFRDRNYIGVRTGILHRAGFRHTEHTLPPYIGPPSIKGHRRQATQVKNIQLFHFVLNK